MEIKFQVWKCESYSIEFNTVKYTLEKLSSPVWTRKLYLFQYRDGPIFCVCFFFYNRSWICFVEQLVAPVHTKVDYFV